MSVSDSDLLKYNSSLGYDQYGLNATLIKVSSTLAGLLLAVFAYEGDRRVSGLYELAEFYEVEVVRDEQDRVTLVVLVDTIPQLLGKETKPRPINMLIRVDIRQPPERCFNPLTFTYTLYSIRMNFRQNYRSKYILVAILVKNEF